MKVTVDIDCTPEEARRFLGLPDLGPVHEIYVEKMKRTLAEGLTPEHLTQAMKSWGPMSEGAMAMWRTMFDQVVSKPK